MMPRCQKVSTPRFFFESFINNQFSRLNGEEQQDNEARHIVKETFLQNVIIVSVWVITHVTFFVTLKKSIFVLRLRGTASKRNTGSTTLFYSLSLTFLIKSLISLSIHNIFDDEMCFDGKRISFVSKSCKVFGSR